MEAHCWTEEEQTCLLEEQVALERQMGVEEGVLAELGLKKWAAVEEEC